ncbi:MAG TPA: sigma-70 family RNA polymerase sigma factor [Polyangiaceae bacterium]|jgi:RNA polymerase sigma-32 factor|nr:sigma-70 family RNA polymerase sigma factor [Polyangiaceae bacterium]
MALQTDPSLTHYITAAYSYPQLTREAELVLMKRWLEEHDEVAREELIRAHLRYVVSIALKYRRYGLPLGELVAEGNFGVVHALQKFDTARGTRFVTYSAYWVRAYILNHIIRSWSMVGGGSGALRSKMFFKLRRERVRIANLVGEGEQADELLAKALDLPAATVSSMLRSLDARDVSLDAKVYGDSSTTLGDTLEATAPNQEEGLVGSEVRGYVREAVRTALTGLDQRERYIVENRLMADNEDEVSLAEIGRRLGVSRERARQLEARAKKKLKSRITELSRGNGWLDVHDAA